MLTMRFAVPLFSISLLVLDAGVVCAQDYPSRPVRLVTTGVGGGSDFGARLMAHGLTGALGQQVIVDNRPTGVTAIEMVAKAPPDGHNLLFYSNGMWTLPLLQKMSYDPVRDFSPVTLTNLTPNVLVVPASLPVKSVSELIALAKARPGELNYASTTTGSSNHLAAELLNSIAGVTIVRVTYKSTGPALIDLMGGRVDLMFSTPAPVAPHIKSGRLKALAVTSAQPSALAPGLPTVAASGLPGYEIGVVYGMFAPAKTPARLVDRLNRECVQVLNQPDVRQKFFDSGVESIGSSPAELAAFLKSEMARLGKVIKDVGLRAE